MFSFRNCIKLANKYKSSSQLKLYQFRTILKLRKNVKIELNEKNATDISKQCQEYNINKKLAVKKLEELFHLRQYVALNIVSKHKKLSTVTGKLLSDNFEICKKNKISETSMLKYPEILGHRDLEAKCNLLKKLPYNLDTTCVLLKLNHRILMAFINRQAKECEGSFGGRIDFFAKLFEESEQCICIYLEKYIFLLSTDCEKIESSFKVLRSYGIEREDILKDMWALRNSTQKIEEKLSFARDAKVDKMKTWMVRATPEILNTYIKRISDNKRILGNHSILEYLSERLDCTVEQAKNLINKQPVLRNKSLTKMQEIIDFLLKKGFKPIHIYRVPKILLHSVKTTQARLKELENQDVQLDSLYLLTKSQKQFKQYCEAFVKCNKIKPKV